MAVQTIYEEKLWQFIKEYNEDQCSLELLHFWSRHPKTRFSQRAIMHTLKMHKYEADKALSRLSEKGILVKNAEKGVTIYSLTREEALFGLIMKIATLDWRQFHSLLEQTHE